MRRQSNRTVFRVLGAPIFSNMSSFRRLETEPSWHKRTCGCFLLSSLRLLCGVPPELKAQVTDNAARKGRIKSKFYLISTTQTRCLLSNYIYICLNALNLPCKVRKGLDIVSSICRIGRGPAAFGDGIFPNKLASETIFVFSPNPASYDSIESIELIDRGNRMYYMFYIGTRSESVSTHNLRRRYVKNLPP